MKFNCGMTCHEYEAYLRERAKELTERGWHRWFAWFPVRVGYKDCRWLEYVERNIDAIYDSWPSQRIKKYCRYRSIPKPKL